MTEAVAVIEADRQAAARYVNEPIGLVQAFAAHRLAARREALEEAARVAEEYAEEREGSWHAQAASAVASAIRNLAQEPRA